MPDPEMTVQELCSENFDKLIVAQTGIRKEIFAFSGNEVIYVKYFGKMEAESIIPFCHKHSILLIDRTQSAGLAETQILSKKIEEAIGVKGILDTDFWNSKLPFTFLLRF